MNPIVANQFIEINRLLFSANSEVWNFIGIFDNEFEFPGLCNFCNKNLRFEFNFKYKLSEKAKKHFILCEDCSKELLNI